MLKEQDESNRTSRRQFTKAVVTAAVAAPIAVSLVGCGKTTTETPGPTGTPGTPARVGVAREECFASSGQVLDHIPPMGFDGGGGSMIIDTRNGVNTSDQRPPFHYKELDTITDARDMMGEIDEVRVITELIDAPFLTDVRYTGFPEDCQLLLWYQKINPTPGPPPTTPPSPRPGPADCVYMPDNFQRPPDVQIVGGRQSASPSRRFEMIFKDRQLGPQDMSYKCSRSFRYKDANDASPRSHFRIGKWMVALIGPTPTPTPAPIPTPINDSNGRPIQDSVNTQLPTPRPEHFRLYVTFKHYQPHP